MTRTIRYFDVEDLELLRPGELVSSAVIEFKRAWLVPSFLAKAMLQPPCVLLYVLSSTGPEAVIERILRSRFVAELAFTLPVEEGEVVCWILYSRRGGERR